MKDLTKRPTPVVVATAITLIKSVLANQNTSYRVCECCGLKLYEDNDSRRVANKLEGTIKTLENVLRGLS